MPVQLVVDNTTEDSLGNILRAAHHAAAGEPLPQDMIDLLLQIDIDALEADYRKHLSQKPANGSERTKPDLRVVG